MIISKQITFGVPLGTYIEVDRLLLMVVIGMTSSSHVPDSTPIHAASPQPDGTLGCLERVTR
jgi:hypothetical protein